MNFGQSHGGEAFGVGIQPKRNKTKSFFKNAQLSVSPENPDLILEQLLDLGGLKQNQCSRILSNYDFLRVCLTLMLFPSCGWWVNCAMQSAVMPNPDQCA